MIFYSLVLGSIISTLALWGVVLAVGIWIYRRFKLRSIPWVGAYVILSWVVKAGIHNIDKHIFDNMDAQITVPFGLSLGQFTAAIDYGDAFLSNLAMFLFIMFIFSEIISLLSRTGMEGESKLFSRFLAFRDRSTPLGIVMIALMLFRLAIVGTAYLYYA